MVDPLPSPATGEDAGVGPDRGSSPSYPGTPRWVKVSGMIVIVLVLLAGIVMFASGGRHGPSRHLSSGEASAHAPPIAHGA
ncbi:MAG TPA: hypothetical protein VGW38_27740 [Chloroflexota bacterium]|nr:hypothetical protein [Chloroflexota bacterium]